MSLSRELGSDCRTWRATNSLPTQRSMIKYSQRRRSTIVVRVFAAGGRVMGKRIWLGAGVAIAMAFSWASAHAQLFAMPSGPGALYFGIEGGWTSLADNTNNIRLGNVSFTRKFDDGFNVGARAGYEWGPLRFEE